MGPLFEYDDTCQCIYFFKGGGGALKLNSDIEIKNEHLKAVPNQIYMCIVYVGTTFKYRH